MKSIGPTTPYGHSLFCDDIRHEESGKKCYIGTYGDDLIVFTELPVRLPKICISVHYVERPGESDEPVELRVYFPGDDEETPRLRGPIPIESLRDQDFSSQTDEDVVIRVKVDIELSPCDLAEAGSIKVRAYRGGLEIRMGTLLVRSAPAPQRESNDPPTATD